ncbi:MAG TPA: CBS domain-containing protein [Burkholderiales bacterium]|jgi:CBS domain-containing protein|nr:CBS domain-containing protein [Burkholderiales bacterium]
MKLGELCTPTVAWCESRASAAQAARLMREKHVGDLIVVDDPDDGRVPLGVVTDRDLVIQVMAKGLDPDGVKVADLMRTPVVIADESEDAAAAIARMRQHGVRRLPVVGSRGALRGVVTLDDLWGRLAAEAAALDAVVTEGQRKEARTRR